MRVRDRDATAAHELDVEALPERDRQRGGSARPLCDGPGRNPDRRAFRARDARLQGPTARDLVRAVLRDGRITRLCTWLLDPDGRAAADRLGRTRGRGGPLGIEAARV